MSPARSSRAVTTGYRLVTLFLVAGLAFGAFQLVNAAVGIARDGERLVGGRSLDVHVELPPERVRLPRGFERNGWLPVKVQVKDPTATQILLSTGLDFSQTALWVAMLWLLRGLAGSVKDGEPFGAANVRRLRGLGSLFVFGGLLLQFIDMGLRNALFDRLPLDRFGNIGSRGLELPGVWLLAGLGAYILAEVFAHGLRLREDVEGTV